MPAHAARRLVISDSSIVTIDRLTWIAVPMVSRIASSAALMRARWSYDVAEVVLRLSRRPAARGRRAAWPTPSSSGATAWLQRPSPCASARTAARCWRAPRRARRSAPRSSRARSPARRSAGSSGRPPRPSARRARSPSRGAAARGSRSARSRTPRKPCSLRLRTDSTKFGRRRPSTSPSRSSSVGVELEQVHHGEHRVAVLLDLRPLVAVARVLDRQRRAGRTPPASSASSASVASSSATQTKQPGRSR